MPDGQPLHIHDEMTTEMPLFFLWYSVSELLMDMSHSVQYSCWDPRFSPVDYFVAWVVWDVLDEDLTKKLTMTTVIDGQLREESPQV